MDLPKSNFRRIIFAKTFGARESRSPSTRSIHTRGILSQLKVGVWFDFSWRVKEFIEQTSAVVGERLMTDDIRQSDGGVE